jgi:micrococcal nuclease
VSQKNTRFLISSILFLVFLGFQIYKKYYPQKSVLSVSEISKQLDQNSYQVSKVIDGDTISVLMNGKNEKIRILGINTPETVDPRRRVECFGREASDHAKSILTNQSVKLEADPSQDDKDKYGRLLRYVFLLNGTDYGLEMIRSGYAYEYTYDIPYKYQKEYKSAQMTAEKAKSGLWSDKTCSGNL